MPVCLEVDAILHKKSLRTHTRSSAVPEDNGKPNAIVVVTLAIQGLPNDYLCCDLSWKRGLIRLDNNGWEKVRKRTVAQSVSLDYLQVHMAGPIVNN